MWLSPAGRELLERDRDVLSVELLERAIAVMPADERLALMDGGRCTAARRRRGRRVAADTSHPSPTLRTRKGTDMTGSATCESCGMPIESGRYCQHCVDETGALQSFDKRFERMIAWEARRRPEATRAELEASTLAYMANLPAWRDHPASSAPRVPERPTCYDATTNGLEVGAPLRHRLTLVRLSLSANTTGSINRQSPGQCDMAASTATGRRGLRLIGCNRAAQWPSQLGKVPLRRRFVRPIGRGHPPDGQAQRAERQVNPGELSSEVAVVRQRVGGMVPMVKLRCGDQPSQRAEADPYVGVNENRLQGDKNEVAPECSAGETECDKREDDARTLESLVDRVEAGSSEPIEPLARMMNSVEAPEPRHSVRCPVSPVAAD